MDYNFNAILGATSNMAAGVYSGRNAMKMQDKAIKAQQEANEQNIAFQERVNQANLQNARDINNKQLMFSREINDLQRYDSKHAISDKKLDLQRAGYSTADPSMNGFSAANLSSPSLTTPQMVSPHVDPVFGADDAANSLSFSNSVASNITSLMETLSTIDLQKSQEKLNNVHASSQEVELAYLPSVLQSTVANMQATYDNLLKDGNIKLQEYKRLQALTSSIEVQTDIMFEQLDMVKFENDTQAINWLQGYQFRASELLNSLADLNVKSSEISLNKAKTTEAYASAELSRAKKAYTELETWFAQRGVSMTSTDIFSTFIRLASAPNSADILPQAIQFFRDAFSGVFDEVNTHIREAYGIDFGERFDYDSSDAAELPFGGIIGSLTHRAHRRKKRRENRDGSNTEPNSNSNSTPSSPGVFTRPSRPKHTTTPPHANLPSTKSKKRRRKGYN